MKRLSPAVPAVAALAALGIARLLPDSGIGLGLRLAAATVVLLVPGALVARALRVRGVSGALVWTLTALFAGMALMFAIHSSLWLALAVLLVAGLVALPFAGERESEGSRLALVAGMVFGILLWRVSPSVIAGDAPFHLARVRKLDAFGSLALRTVDEFRDGGLHPGYAFPLWHGFLALVGRLAGVDPTEVVRHESAVLAPVAFLVIYEAGAALFRSKPLGIAVAAAEVALFGLAPAHGGAFRTLALPATSAQLLLVPAALALAFRAVAEPSAPAFASVAAAGLVLALVHPTYALFLLVPVAGWAIARAVLARTDLRTTGGAFAALLAPTAAVSAWLLPLARETASRDPSQRTLTQSRHGFAQYPGQIDVFSPHRFRLAPEMVDRRGAIAVAALACVPLAAFAPRRRWAAFVLGGSLAVLGLLLIPDVFARFSDAVSLSQSRRAASFVPLPFALAGGAAVLARPVGSLLPVVGLGAGIWLQLAYPGDFGYVLGSGGPAAVTWFAAIGGAVGFLAAAVLPNRWNYERRGWSAAAAVLLLCLPVAVSGFRHWSVAPTPSSQELPPALVTALRDRVPKGAVVFSDPETSYLVGAAAPVYVASDPPAHVADTKANRPAARVRAARRFLRTGQLAIPRRYGAGWILVDSRRARLTLALPRVYGDGRYTLYRLR